MEGHLLNVIRKYSVHKMWYSDMPKEDQELYPLVISLVPYVLQKYGVYLDINHNSDQYNSDIKKVTDFYFKTIWIEEVPAWSYEMVSAFEWDNELKIAKDHTIEELKVLISRCYYKKTKEILFFRWW